MLRNFTLGLLLAFLTISSLQAQQSREVTPDGGRRWWYGSHFALGFGASTFQSQFTFGVAPMAGYKVLPFLSVGPRISVLYNNFRLRYTNEVQKINTIDWAAMAFVRADVYQGFFIQADLGYESLAFPNAAQNYETERYSGLNAYIGAGYNQSSYGSLGYEIMLAYSLNLQGLNTLSLVDYRVGFTKFF